MKKSKYFFCFLISIFFTIILANNSLAASSTNKSISIKSISLNKSSEIIEKGFASSLKVQFNPSNATNKAIYWSSSNTNVATVKNGVVSAIGGGKATITARTSNGKIATCSVKVIIPVKSIILNYSSATLEKGSTLALKVQPYPSNTTNKAIYWSSSNTNVATVEKGIVKAVGGGRATITAKTSNGKIATCSVKVIIPVKSIILNYSSATLEKGSAVALKVKPYPSNTTNKAIYWSSSNTNVATVKNGVVSAIGGGRATITARTSNGKTATCSVKVTVPVNSIALNYSSAALEKDSTLALKVQFTPSNATNKTINWKSLNTSVATVSSSGIVTPVSVGKATIVATSKNGNIATCLITVKGLDKLNFSLQNTRVHQGGDIYDGKFFIFKAGGKCTVFDIKNGNPVDYFKLPNGSNSFPHCNSVSFSNQFYSKSDKYPLVYINAYNDEGIPDGVCFVYRLITDKNEKISAELVQTIKIGFINNTIWKKSSTDRRTFGNFVIDRKNNYMYVYNLRENKSEGEKKTRFFKFKIPNISQGSSVVLKQTDILEMFDCPHFPYIQDSVCYNGKLYIVSGIGAGYLREVNLKTKQVRSVSLPRKQEGNFEPEAIGIYNGFIIMSITDYKACYLYKAKL